MPYFCITLMSSSLSFIGSSAIVYIILKDWQTKLIRVHNRLILGISIIDLLHSIALGFSFIPSPRINDCSFGFGNELTCTTQGFFLVLGLAVPSYNTMLSLYYTATIVYSISEESIAQKYEPFMHLYAFLPSLAGASIGAIKNFTSVKKGSAGLKISVCTLGNVILKMGMEMDSG